MTDFIKEIAGIKFVIAEANTGLWWATPHPRHQHNENSNNDIFALNPKGREFAMSNSLGLIFKDKIREQVSSTIVTLSHLPQSVPRT